MSEKEAIANTSSIPIENGLRQATFTKVKAPELKGVTTKDQIDYWMERLNYESIISKTKDVEAVSVKQSIDPPVLQFLAKYRLKSRENEITEEELRDYFEKQMQITDPKVLLTIDFNDLFKGVKYNLKEEDIESRVDIFFFEIEEVIRKRRISELMKGGLASKQIIQTIIGKIAPTSVRHMIEKHGERVKEIETLIELSDLIKQYAANQQMVFNTDGEKKHGMIFNKQKYLMINELVMEKVIKQKHQKEK